MVLVNDVKIRFRHSSGDLGPYLFASGCKVKDLKERLYQEWPADGSFGAAPKSAAEVSVILGGRFLEEDEPVAGLLKHFGEIKPNTTITMHALVRTIDPTKQHGRHDKQKAPKACCSIQ